MPTAPVIETQALTKVFGPQRALDGVNLTVAPGAIGLLGPNGAGKSTFMKCLLQLQPITSGSAKLLGREVGREGREIRTSLPYYTLRSRKPKTVEKLCSDPATL
jgi:ABC-2 type transport system ATP-binding protein